MPGRVVKYHVHVVGVALVALAAAVLLLVRPGLKHDYRLEAFVAAVDESYRTFRSFMDEFSSNEVAIIAIRSGDALSPASQQLAGELIERVRGIGAVQNVVAVAAFPKTARLLLGERLYTHPLVQDTLLSGDRRTAAIITQMAGETGSGAERRTTVAQLKSIVGQARTTHPDVEMHLAGPYVTLIDMYAYVDRDLLIFSVAAFALLMATLWAVFRGAPPMVYAMAVSVTATVVTLALSIVLGIVASLITQMIVILVTVLAVATCVHLAVAAEEIGLRRPGASWRDLAAATLGRMLRPCTAVIVTTAAGFGSVCISRISPIRSFGVLMVLGLLIALVLALAACVALIRRQTRDHPRPAPTPDVAVSGLSGALSRLGLWVCGHRAAVMAGCLALAVVCAWGTRELRFESDFVKNFRPESDVRRAYEFVDRHLTPVGSVELVVRRRDGTPLVTGSVIRKAHRLGQRIVERFPSMRKALTLADVLTDGATPLPADSAAVAARLTWARALFGDDLLRGFVNADRTAIRINLRAVEGVNVGEKLRIDDGIRRMTGAAFGDGYTVTVTGLYHFYAQLVSGLLRDQYRSFALTLPAVFVVLLVAFRSPRLAVLAMIPNLLPILLCIGVMGWARIPVNMTTAMMLSVSFGIAVDDAVHYLWRFRHEFDRSGDYRAAMAATHGSVGRACVFTTVVIAGGFWILVLSQFLPTAYFGALIAVTMAGALAADLLLLPVLILLFRPFGPQT